MLSNCCATKLSFRLCKIENKNLNEVVLKQFHKIVYIFTLLHLVYQYRSVN